MLKLSFTLKQKIWNIDDVEDASDKILTIAQKRYKGWRSSFSYTYKAYSTDAERMKHKPEDLDIVEWYYLIQYFGSDSFQVRFKQISLLNSSFVMQLTTLCSYSFCRKLVQRIQELERSKRLSM
jgi:hypothetical protein